MPDLTCIYITHNQERRTFERNIHQHLTVACNATPIISVSQRPIRLGHNICMGMLGASNSNAWKQVLTGIKAATTKFVCIAESDCLYPPDYFTFTPPHTQVIYYAAPVYILFAMRGKAKYYALKRKGTELAIVAGRDFLIESITTMLQSSSEDTFVNTFRSLPKAEFTLSAPIVSIKTDRNMHRATPHATHNKLATIPHWGDAHDLLRILKDVTAQ